MRKHPRPISPTRSYGAFLIGQFRAEHKRSAGMDDLDTDYALVRIASHYLGSFANGGWPVKSFGEPADKKPDHELTTGERIKQLATAGAFIAAEIDRLHRLAEHNLNNPPKTKEKRGGGKTRPSIGWLTLSPLSA